MVEKLNHKKLIEYIATHPRDEFAWREFLKRFDKHLCHSIFRACHRLCFQAGMRDIADIAQDVYLRLLENDCARLKNFSGEHTYSIFRYLTIIALRIVYNRIAAGKAKRRIPLKKLTSIDFPVWSGQNENPVRLKDLLPAENFSFFMQEFEDTLQSALHRVLKSRPYKRRDTFIFYLYFFEGHSPKKIARHPDVQLKPKSVSNILTALGKQVEQAIRTVVLEEAKFPDSDKKRETDRSVHSNIS